MATPAPHAFASPASPWVQRWSHLVANGGQVLDVACGGGRHLAWFAQRGHPVTGVDIDTASAATRVPQATLVQADIESGPWPLLVDGVAPQQFDAVIITNYLWRPLMGTLLACLAPGGVLLYETFSQGNETVGRPARAEFLLQPGELLQTFAPLQVVAYENGYLENPPRFVQRIAAVRPAGSGQPPTLPDVYRL